MKYEKEVEKIKKLIRKKKAIGGTRLIEGIYNDIDFLLSIEQIMLEDDELKDIPVKEIFPLFHLNEYLCPVCKKNPLKKDKKYCSRKCFYNRNK